MLSIELILLWLRKNWLTLLMCAIMFIGYKYHQHLVKEAYQDGYSESQTDAANESQKREVALRTEREREKAELESKQLVELALRDGRIRDLDNASDRMRTELERIAGLASHYTGVKSSGGSAREAVRLLAELLGESQAAYRRTAAEADRYYFAGITCQRQYYSLRGNYENQTIASASQTNVLYDDK